ncbi:MAG: winged helix-turn-helix transcriptional regulator [Herminiimonas sp.]|nr:winged helix-turn-helix transcriptional regulator [Herminiimonas sp.]
MPSTDKQDLHLLFAMVSKYFSVLSEPTRLNILHALCNGERTVGEIVEATEATQTNVSRHLKLMFDAKILLKRKEGTLVYYRVANEHTVNLCRGVCTQMAIEMESQQKVHKKLAKNFTLQE